MPATLADRSNHHALIELPELLQHWYRLLIGEEDGHNSRDDVIDKVPSIIEVTLTEGQQEVLGKLADRLL